MSVLTRNLESQVTARPGGAANATATLKLSLPVTVALSGSPSEAPGPVTVSPTPINLASPPGGKKPEEPQRSHHVVLRAVLALQNRSKNPTKDHQILNNYSASRTQQHPHDSTFLSPES